VERLFLYCFDITTSNDKNSRNLSDPKLEYVHTLKEKNCQCFQDIANEGEEPLNRQFWGKFFQKCREIMPLLTLWTVFHLLWGKGNFVFLGEGIFSAVFPPRGVSGDALQVAETFPILYTHNSQNFPASFTLLFYSLIK
jgi:hypothetical protein